MVIDENCFTLTKFAEYLTNNYTKYSGREFTAHEGKEFAKNGKLPDKYGGHKLKLIHHKSSGLKFIEIDIS